MVVECALPSHGVSLLLSPLHCITAPIGDNDSQEELNSSLPSPSYHKTSSAAGPSRVGSGRLMMTHYDDDDDDDDDSDDDGDDDSDDVDDDSLR